MADVSIFWVNVTSANPAGFWAGTNVALCPRLPQQLLCGCEGTWTRHPHPASSSSVWCVASRMFAVAHISREHQVTQTLCHCPHLPDAELRCPEDLADTVLGFLQLLCHSRLLETMSTFPCQHWAVCGSWSLCSSRNLLPSAPWARRVADKSKPLGMGRGKLRLMFGHPTQ